MDIRGIASLINLSVSLAGYFNLIETSDTKQLIGSYLGAGINALKQAINSDQEKISLLREARSRFNKAILLEKEDRLALAHLGLAICHDCLGDKSNCLFSLNEIEKVTIPLTKDALILGASFFLPIFIDSYVFNRQRKVMNSKFEQLEGIKLYSREYLSKIENNTTRIQSLDELMV